MKNANAYLEKNGMRATTNNKEKELFQNILINNLEEYSEYKKNMVDMTADKARELFLLESLGVDTWLEIVDFEKFEAFAGVELTNEQKFFLKKMWVWYSYGADAFKVTEFDSDGRENLFNKMMEEKNPFLEKWVPNYKMKKIFAPEEVYKNLNIAFQTKLQEIERIKFQGEMLRKMKMEFVEEVLKDIL